MNPTPPQDNPEKKPDELSTVERSVSRDGAFSKPGHFGKAPSKGKGWAPAKGVRFRPTNEKTKGRMRKRKADPRRITWLT